MQNTVIASKLRGGGGTDSLIAAPDKRVGCGTIQNENWNAKRIAFLRTFSFTDAFSLTGAFSVFAEKTCKKDFSLSEPFSQTAGDSRNIASELHSSTVRSKKPDGGDSYIPTPGLNSAFTLAEVLITLGIIGIVAAMTLPSLVNNHKEKELITRTKKLYSNIQNAVILGQKDLGVIGDNSVLFDVTQSHAQAAHKFAKYFNGAKVCESKSQKGCSQYYYSVKYATKKTSGGDDTTIGASLTGPKIILNDGSIIQVTQYTSCRRVQENDCVQDANGNCVKDEYGNTTNKTTIHTNCADLHIDVNGTKLPNQYGADIYNIKIMQNKLSPGFWAPYGATSFRNILTGKDKLQYTKYSVGSKL